MVNLIILFFIVILLGVLWYTGDFGVNKKVIPAKTYNSVFQEPEKKTVKTKKVLDEVWNLEKIEYEFYASNDFSLFFDYENKIGLDYEKKDISKVKPLKAYYRDEMLKNYMFVRNLCKYVDTKVSENNSWAFTKYNENMLYELRYKTPNSLHDLETHRDLSISSVALLQTAKFFAGKLDEYDKLDKKNNFVDYEFIEKIQLRCSIISDFLKKKGNDSINNDSVSRVNFVDTKDIGIVTNYKGKPFTGIGYHLQDSGDLDSEFNMLNGLKQGISKAFNEKGEVIKTSFFEKDVEVAFSTVTNYGVFHSSIDSAGTRRLRLDGSTQDSQYKNNICFYNPIEKSQGIEFEIYKSDLEIKSYYNKEEIMNLEDGSEELIKVNLFNLLLMEGGLKHLFKEHSNDVWVYAAFILKEFNINTFFEPEDDNDTYLKDKLFTGVGYQLHPNGKILGTLSFNNGKRHGVSKEFDMNGGLVKSWYWIDGEMILTT
mgnify:CR=1 FL=1|tara:strand:+ start:4720 stop:6171 length:1452 start_codon:yes stop_codon:yes gene_type:complete